MFEIILTSRKISVACLVPEISHGMSAPPPTLDHVTSRQAVVVRCHEGYSPLYNMNNVNSCSDLAEMEGGGAEFCKGLKSLP